jgi:hypothetical protein
MISIKSRLDSHFRLAAAAATSAAAVSATSSANAAIVYSGLQNVPIFPIADNGGVYFDFEAPFTSAQGTRPDGWDVNPYASGASIYLASNTAIVLAGATAADLAFGTPITAASLFVPISAERSPAVASRMPHSQQPPPSRGSLRPRDGRGCDPWSRRQSGQR